MTDRELLELAAKAAGYKIAWEGGCVTGWMAGGGWWNPLTDDGDALRLAVALAMDVDLFNGVVICASIDVAIECDDYRRAIVRAAAEIGRQHE